MSRIVIKLTDIDRLCRVAERLGLTQTQLATQTGVSRYTLYKICHFKSERVAAETMIKLQNWTDLHEN